jgi:ribosomal protein L37AE/L43A
MKILLEDYNWCSKHAEYTTKGVWQCKTTAANILATTIGRSLHNGPFEGSGGGDVVKVIHLHCPKCNPEWQGPSYGTPIKPEQIFETE